MAAKSLASLSQKYRGKPKKFAEGGRARSPAAAPVATPFDADYIERLAAQAVGVGEPVTEVRSSEGRGFVPMARSFGEAGQRMSAVLRGDVEPTPEEERQINVVRGFAEGPASIRAYHGSPHRFERFDISKIGTGEGAQAYGRGLYFAENEAIAKWYRDALSPPTYGSWGQFNPVSNDSYAARLSRMFSDDGSKFWRGDRNITDIARKISGKPKINDGLEEYTFRDGSKLIASEGGWDISAPVPTGSLYEVRLRTTPEELVNWNAPLVQQPDRAIPFLEDVLRAPRTGSARVLEREMKPIGEAVNLRTPEVAAQLREAGVPGIRYLDAGSRTGQRDTHNYVMFGDDLIDITRRYAEGGLAALDQKYADGGTVRAPKETYISGQEHKLAYITDREAALLKARGGSGRMTEHGVRAYDEGDGPGGGDSDSSNSNSEAGTQDAADGNAGQGAGPTGAGAGAGPSGPSDSETGVSGSEDTAPDTETETTTTAPTTAPTATTGPFGQAPNTTGLGAFGTAVGLATGVPGLGTIGSVVGSVMDAANLNAQLGMMGLEQSVSPATAAVNAATMGVVGQSAVDQFGQALGFDALAEAPMSAFSTPSPGPSAPSDMGGGEYGEYGQTQYGTSDLANIATAASTAGSAPQMWDWNKIQAEAARRGMSTSEYMAQNWRNVPLGMPTGYSHGGLAKLHQKYAEGGEVYPPAGEIAEYDPDEIDRIARQIHLRLPEDERQDVVYEEAASPSDLIMRARMLMRGQNMGMPEAISAGAGNDRFNSSTSLRDMPIEDARYGVSQRTLNTNIDAVLDAERKARIGVGMLALERGGEKGFTGYGPQVSAGYGPLSVHGGYQSITPNMLGAKSQGSYVYGGNLNIPIDDGGTEANIGATVMSGRRRQDGTQITGSLERPFLGGRLGLDVSADPSLRNKEILLGYRRAF